MAALIEIGLIFFLGFSVGYAVRAMISHHRHRRARALRDMSDFVHSKRNRLGG
jgi:hypothetical protein